MSDYNWLFFNNEFRAFRTVGSNSNFDILADLDGNAYMMNHNNVIVDFKDKDTNEPISVEQLRKVVPCWFY